MLVGGVMPGEVIMEQLQAVNDLSLLSMMKHGQKSGNCAPSEHVTFGKGKRS